MSSFLKNSWYLAAWSAEVGAAPLARRICDRPIVLYRGEGAAVIALHDACPHRFAPLSAGQVEGSRLRCGYHGLVFDERGACVENPFSPARPAAACTRSYLVLEQDRMVWIWLGDPASADPTTVPRYGFLSDPAMRNVFGCTAVAAHYELLTDNLMDLTHARFLHPAFGGELYNPAHRWSMQGDVVTSCYEVTDIPNPPLFELTFPTGGAHVDLWDDITWRAPACLLLESGFKRHGSPRAGGLCTPSAHVITPETSRSSHYFWASGNSADNPMSDEDLKQGLSQAFEGEDKPMIEAVQRRMGDADFWSLNPVLLKTDAAAVMARRILARRLAEEADR